MTVMTTTVGGTLPHMLKLGQLGPKPKVKRVKTTRSKNGCLTCRKRRKKCDELKPTCTSCTRRQEDCIWPQDGDESSKKSINSMTLQLHSRDTNEPSLPLEQSRCEVQPDNPRTVYLDIILAAEEKQPKYEGDNAEPFFSHGRSPTPEGYAVLDAENHLSLKRANFATPQLFSQSPPTNLYPTSSQRFMYACVNGFIASQGPQYTHPLLTTVATFTPLLEQNEVMKIVAEACGCSFLSWSNPDLTELGNTKYQRAMKTLTDFLHSGPITKRDEVWLGAAFQLLCLSSKVTWNCDNRLSVRNLNNSYKLIMVRSKRLQKPALLRHICGPVTSSEGIFEEVTGENLKMEIENSLIGYESSQNAKFERQFERMFIESFIYNFSISLLITDDCEGLPNPFEVFRTLKSYLKTPLFRCDVAWMNNPVLGAAFDAFEMVAKSSYLVRHLDDPSTRPCASRLLEIASYYPSPMIPPEIRVNEHKYSNLRDSVLMADIVMKAAKIVLRKAIDPMLSEYDIEIQRDVEFVASKLKKIPQNSPVWVIAPWSMFIIGLSSLNLKHRDTVLDALFTTAEMVHGRYVGTIVDILELSWGMGSKNGLNSLSRGLEVLLDQELLSLVYI